MKLTSISRRGLLRTVVGLLACFAWSLVAAGSAAAGSIVFRLIKPVSSVMALAADPVAPATLYAGTEVGVFKTTDGGVTWRAASVGLADPLVTALAIDPVTPSTVYAGTNAGGVFKTTDGGETWRVISTGLPAAVILRFPAPPGGLAMVLDLVVDPGRPASVYAVTE